MCVVCSAPVQGDVVTLYFVVDMLACVKILWSWAKERTQR